MPLKKLREIIDKYRQESIWLHHNTYHYQVSWYQTILETIFLPQIKVPGKEPMSHLHPDIDKLHLPEGVYIADWRKYRVEDHPMLINFQKRCHAEGLHDPWLRNYAFQCYPNNVLYRSRMAGIMRGCLTGFCIATVICASYETYRYFYPVKYQHTQKYREKYGDVEIEHH